ncbi:hypothetical protein [Bradyrhizobium murdochi]|uniref:hypothetical protein n=1 Tax=Bradyrhizobium murdochi TaxID=1038859 RepID=UPI0003F9B0D3|nr:hypothetical protein [Bradyrhizobium murdochi]
MIRVFVTTAINEARLSSGIANETGTRFFRFEIKADAFADIPSVDSARSPRP